MLSIYFLIILPPIFLPYNHCELWELSNKLVLKDLQEVEVISPLLFSLISKFIEYSLRLKIIFRSSIIDGFLTYTYKILKKFYFRLFFFLFSSLVFARGLTMYCSALAFRLYYNTNLFYIICII